MIITSSSLYELSFLFKFDYNDIRYAMMDMKDKVSALLPLFIRLFHKDDYSIFREILFRSIEKEDFL